MESQVLSLSKPRVYDCFPFFNELDLLEVRLEELNEVVDEFVLVEATRNFRKQPKPLLFQKNKARYKKYLHKITHVIVDDYPNFFTRFRIPNNWDYEINQKDRVALGLLSCEPHDVIIVSDLDEIPRAEKVMEAMQIPGEKVFRTKMFHYFLNFFVEDYNENLSYAKEGSYKPWQGSVMVNYRDFVSFDFHRTRRNTDFTAKVLIEDGGWHLSWFGGFESVVSKLKSYSHVENKFTSIDSPQQVRDLILQGLDVTNMGTKIKMLDPFWDCPRVIRENPTKYSNFILSLNE